MIQMTLMKLIQYLTVKLSTIKFMCTPKVYVGKNSQVCPCMFSLFLKVEPRVSMRKGQEQIPECNSLACPTSNHCRAGLRPGGFGQVDTQTEVTGNSFLFFFFCHFSSKQNCLGHLAGQAPGSLTVVVAAVPQSFLSH